MTGILNILAGSISSAIKDGYFNLVSLLLPGNGTNGAQNNTFLDSSSNNFTITRNGNTTQGTFSPFSQTGWSNYFDGTGDYLTLPNSASFNFGTGDYTIEGWVWSTTRSVANTFFANGTDNCNVYIVATSGLIGLWTGTTNTSSTALPLNQWNHIAVVRSGSGSNNTQIYLNGVSILAITNTTNFPNTAFFIGRNGSSGGEYMNGYISNVRVTKGRAVYTSSFTPPTSPLGKTSGGQNPPQGTECTLLTCQSNRFVDNSDAALTVTPNADSSVQAFSPFAPTAAYDSSVVGGSGYFDGTGDYLTMASNAALAPGTGDFTIEAWLYPTAALSTYNSVYETAATNGLLFGKITSGYGVRSAGTADLISSTAPAINQWVHVAASRSGTSLRLFINGELKATVTDSTNFATGIVSLGASNAGTNAFPGYISGLRFVKGTALYTATFTALTSPPTAVSNTNFLGNFTNAGITDATAKNVLETVGNAQISTTQSKFGGSSMYFDGTGDYLQIPNGSLISLEGDFTIEGWIYVNSLAAGSPTFLQLGNTSNYLLFYISSSDGTFRVAGTVSITSGTVSTGAWKHFALVRSGTATNNIKAYVDGVNTGSATSTVTFVGTSSNGLRIGAEYPSNYYLNGYIDDIRITKGYARYTGNFTPPAAAFPLQ